MQNQILLKPKPKPIPTPPQTLISQTIQHLLTPNNNNNKTPNQSPHNNFNITTTQQNQKQKHPLQNSSFEQNYRDICALLLTLTHTRSLKYGTHLHGYVIKTGIETVPLVTHHLINFYSKTQLPFLSLRVFDESGFGKTHITWSSVISAFAQNELPGLAIEYFRRMVGDQIRPNDHNFPSAIKACAMIDQCDVGKCLHSMVVKMGYGCDVFVSSSLVDMYAKFGSIVDSRKLFDEMPERNVVTWSGLICGYAQLGENEEALRAFKDAVFENLKVNDFTFSSVIRVCGSSTLLELGKQLHAMCVKTSYDSSSFVGSSLVSLYSRCGVIEDAYRVFNEVPVKNLGMWNSMLIACAQHTLINEVFSLFQRMSCDATGIKPNFITFLGLLYACSHAGLVEEGKRYFALMSDHGLEPREQHFASLVDLLGRSGKLEEALSVIVGMPIKPTESVWGSFLTGCKLHKKTELAAQVADRVFESRPLNSGLYVLLANAYAGVGRYEDAAKARKMLRDRGVKKETGLSWVEEGSMVHTFAAGDRSHMKSEEIYNKLEELGEDMERAGYVADTSYVLREVDGDEKNETIKYHSERLAIAFGLITFPDDRPIRVMKNLRVCGDCHTAIKYMSKCTKRVIIVRDNNRFHRFEDGKCSCGDYW